MGDHGSGDAAAHLPRHYFHRPVQRGRVDHERRPAAACGWTLSAGPVRNDAESELRQQFHSGGFRSACHKLHLWGARRLPGGDEGDERPEAVLQDRQVALPRLSAVVLLVLRRELLRLWRHDSGEPDSELAPGSVADESGSILLPRRGARHQRDEQPGHPHGDRPAGSRPPGKAGQQAAKEILDEVLVRDLPALGRHGPPTDTPPIHPRLHGELRRGLLDVRLPLRARARHGRGIHAAERGILSAWHASLAHRNCNFTV
mmetsp:Transcript_10567/g.29870  ORF Transcript_10567/g.29870 Transcript_10567/m.29870 type:complete len:259 (+) Transcript_10567:618-1394(+)